MRRVLASLLLGLLSFTMSAAPAGACINDRETRSSEREFKSQYQESPGTESLSPGGSSLSDQVIVMGAGGLGGALLLGAVGFTLWLSRKPR